MSTRETRPSPTYFHMPNRMEFSLLIAVCLTVIIGCSVLSSGLIPAGVPGEWVWQKPKTTATAREWLWAIAVIAGYLGAHRLLLSMLMMKNGLPIAILLLFPVAGLVQAGLQRSAPDSYGLAKWPLCTYFEGSSGYFTIAVKEVASLKQFLGDYPTWIKSQDCLHIGTHPPGLIVEARLWLDFWASRPNSAKIFLVNLPAEFRDALRNAVPGKSLPINHQAALVSIAMTHWLLCAAVVWPLYFLVRRLDFQPEVAFSVASIWPVVPSSIMFQPASDISFGVLATSAIALSLGGNRQRYYTSFISSICSGLILALGMFLSLVFLPVGLIIAILLLSDNKYAIQKRLERILATGLGFLSGIMAWAVITKSNPVSIWLANTRNHGRFYVEYPRSYYKWLVADAGEVTFGIGLPASLLIALAIIIYFKKRSEMSPAKIKPMFVTILTLLFLALSGKSLSEVSRLWLPFFPILLSGIALVFEQSNSKLINSWVIFWMMIQIVWLQQLIQVVYAV